MKRLVLVLGMHRSGTSLLTQITTRFGAYAGEDFELDGPNHCNEDGYYENLRIRGIHDEILRCHGKYWHSLAISDIKLEKEEANHYKSELVVELKHLFDGHDLVVIKDPRMAYFLNLWEEIANQENIEVSYLYVIRRAEEVSASLCKRDGMPPEFGHLLWEYYNLLLQDFLQEREHFTIHYDDLFSETNIAKIYKYLFGEKKGGYDVAGVVKKDLRHHRMAQTARSETDIDDLIYKEKLGRGDIGKYLNKIEQSGSFHRRIYDFELLNEADFLKDKQVVIYGAGVFGKKASEMLTDLGEKSVCFCDRDVDKIGTLVNGIPVVSVDDVCKMKPICMIVSLSDDNQMEEVKEYCSICQDMFVCTYFALEKLHNMRTFNYESFCGKLSIVNRWYKDMAWRSQVIYETMQSPVVVYQNGKVGSLSVVNVLRDAGIKAAHIHRNFFLTDAVRHVVCGSDMERFARRVSFSENETYRKEMEGVYRGKKIITMVREPISTDLSTVFQWIGGGESDRFFNAMNHKGVSFCDAVFELMKMIRGRLFTWFREELVPATGIDVYEHSFDKNLGYICLKDGNTEVLVLQMEKIDSLYSVIAEFVGTDIHKTEKINTGSSKNYSDLYEKTKDEITIEEEYFNYYYGFNGDVAHFYNIEDIERFKQKWKKHIR